MARFEPQEFNINNINGGERFENGQIPSKDAFNAPIEGSAYAIEQATQAHEKADLALNFAFGSVGTFSPLTAYPIGSIYMSVNNTSPSELFGGSWLEIKDKFLVGAGNLYALGATGGSADAVVVKHSHSIQTTYSQSGNDNSTPTANSDSIQGVQPWLSAYTETYETGEDGTNKNLPPYLAVNIWKRIP